MLWNRTKTIDPQKITGSHRRRITISGLVATLVVFAIADSCLGLTAGAISTSTLPDSGFENQSLSGWTHSPETGNYLEITEDGKGAGIITGPVQFDAGSYPSTACSPAVIPTTWIYGPFGSAAAALQPTGATSFDDATQALGLDISENQAISSTISSQASSSGCGGSSNPTNASWIKKSFTLTAGITYKMFWNYIGTDYVPYNDGSITSLVFVGTSQTTPVITVNNQVQNYALLGFTNPGTGDYSTGSFGSTGWQNSTYQVSVTGEYVLGFAVFNIGDDGLSPALLIDDGIGSVTKNGEDFGAVAPNNPNAPTVEPSATPSASPSSSPASAATLAETGVSSSSLFIPILLLLASGITILILSTSNPSKRLKNRK